MPVRSDDLGWGMRILCGFIAGFLATLTFHQLTLEILWQAGLAPFGAFSMAVTEPFGIPAILSLAFWGGVWGVLFVPAAGSFPRQGGYWLASFLFGALLPSMVALLIVLPLKGKPLGGGWHFPLLFTAFLINGAWGVGTGVVYRMLKKMFGR